jgi:putative transposon-encoded protein
MILTRTKRDINSAIGTARKQGNGAHVMVPKEWIGLEVKVTPVSYIQNKASEQAVRDTSACLSVWDAIKAEHRKRKK